jgi:hypothetical protein
MENLLYISYLYVYSLTQLCAGGFYSFIALLSCVPVVFILKTKHMPVNFLSQNQMLPPVPFFPVSATGRSRGVPGPSLPPSSPPCKHS